MSVCILHVKWLILHHCDIFGEGDGQQNDNIAMTTPSSSTTTYPVQDRGVLDGEEVCPLERLPTPAHRVLQQPRKPPPTQNNDAEYAEGDQL